MIKHTLIASAAVLALSAGAATAQDRTEIGMLDCIRGRRRRPHRDVLARGQLHVPPRDEAQAPEAYSASSTAMGWTSA